jgi:uncharacterized membrane protein YhaH (DUF805 family)
MNRITNAYKDLLKNPMGRISRADFWIVFFFQYAVLFAVLFAEIIFLPLGLYGFTFLITSVANLLFSIKRYHDSGRKGWWILCPIANIIFLFYNSTEDNKWGYRTS